MPANHGTETVTVQHPLTRYADQAGWTIVPKEGATTLRRGESERALFASYLIRARLKADELDPHFFQYFTATRPGLAQLGGRASPAADGKFNVNTKNIDSVLVPLPKPDEQKKIATILQTIDRKVSIHERKRATLTDLFQTMLHQLMTAEIRVDELDIDTSEIRDPQAPNLSLEIKPSSNN